MLGFSPADPGDIEFFSVCDMFSFWTGLVDWPQGPFHTGLVSISSPSPTPTAYWRHELRLNPQKVCFVFCHGSKSNVTEVCFWGNCVGLGQKKQTVIQLFEMD